MNKFLCVLFLLSFASACDNVRESETAGSLLVNNNTCWTLTDLSVDSPRVDKWCFEAIPPGGSIVFAGLDAADIPKPVMAFFDDEVGTCTTSSYSVVVKPGAETVLDLDDLPDCKAAPPSSGSAAVLGR